MLRSVHGSPKVKKEMRRDKFDPVAKNSQTDVKQSLKKEMRRDKFDPVAKNSQTDVKQSFHAERGGQRCEKRWMLETGRYSRVSRVSPTTTKRIPSCPLKEGAACIVSASDCLALDQQQGEKVCIFTETDKKE